MIRVILQTKTICVRVRVLLIRSFVCTDLFLCVYSSIPLRKFFFLCVDFVMCWR